jgi:hypothetical protein
MGYLAQAGHHPAGAPFALYHGTDMRNLDDELPKALEASTVPCNLFPTPYPLPS